METKTGVAESKVAFPLDKVYASKHVIEDSMLQNGTQFNILERVEYPPEGGIYCYFKGMPYPRKGFPTPEAAWMNDVVKRISVFFLRAIGTKDMALPALAFSILPWKMKLRTIEKSIYNFNRVALWMFQSAFLKDEYYCEPCRSMRKLVSRFIFELGIEQRTADDAAKIIATIFEYDDSYRLRFEDMMTETNRAKLISKPLREFRRLASIFRSREKYVDMFSKLDGLVAIGSVALLHPKVRRAFRAAVGSLNADEFRKMQLDEADRYHTLIRGDYDFMGKSFENRIKRLAMIHTTSRCHKAPITAGDFGVAICTECGKECETDLNPPPMVQIEK